MRSRPQYICEEDDGVEVGRVAGIELGGLPARLRSLRHAGTQASSRSAAIRLQAVRSRSSCVVPPDAGLDARELGMDVGRELLGRREPQIEGSGFVSEQISEEGDGVFAAGRDGSDDLCALCRLLVRGALLPAACLLAAWTDRYLAPLLGAGRCACLMSLGPPARSVAFPPPFEVGRLETPACSCCGMYKFALTFRKAVWCNFRVPNQSAITCSRIRCSPIGSKVREDG